MFDRVARQSYSNWPYKSWLSPAVAALLAFHSVAMAQPPAAAPPSASSAGSGSQSLRIIALAGDGEMNDLQKRINAPIVVQVLDQNSRPVEGASVTFRFPASGAGATFPDQKTIQTVFTNADGQAALGGWNANNTTGRFEVQVSATRGSESGAAVIAMTNVTSVADELKKQQHKSWWSKRRNKIIVIGAAAAVAAVLAIVLTRGSGTTTLTAVPGFPTIGGAQ